MEFFLFVTEVVDSSDRVKKLFLCLNNKEEKYFVIKDVFEDDNQKKLTEKEVGDYIPTIEENREKIENAIKSDIVWSVTEPLDGSFQRLYKSYKGALEYFEKLKEGGKSPYLNIRLLLE